MAHMVLGFKYLRDPMLKGRSPGLESLDSCSFDPVLKEHEQSGTVFYGPAEWALHTYTHGCSKGTMSRLMSYPVPPYLDLKKPLYIADPLDQ